MRRVAPNASLGMTAGEMPSWGSAVPGLVVSGPVVSGARLGQRTDSRNSRGATTFTPL